MKLDSELLRYPKIDVHTHVTNLGNMYDMDIVAKYVEDSRKAGIIKSFTSRPFKGLGYETAPVEDFEEANNAVIGYTKKYPGELYGYAYIHPGHIKWARKEIDRCMDEPGMLGIKLYHQYRFDDPVVVDLVGYAAEKDALILLHQGHPMDPEKKKQQPNISDGTNVAELGRQVPGAKIIAGHIGGGGDWEWCAKSLANVRSVYLDTSGSVADAGMIELAVEQLGAERLLFATDMSVDEGIGKILAARISDEDKKAIFKGNFEKLYGRLD